MEILILNTNYNLEYYKRKYTKYQDLLLEAQKKTISLLDENEVLRSKLAELENKRAYTIKLQTSKQ